MMPMPPSCARAMARRASVTVSMAADTSGMFSVMLAGQLGSEVDILGQDGRVIGQEQNVIKGEGFFGNAQHKG